MTTLFAQTWAPVGAIWYYSQATINPNLQSYKTIESIGDTIIQNKACKKMLEIERVYNPVSTRTYFMYSANDSVFYYDELRTEFCLLYFFNAQQGDTIFLDCYDLEVTVDSTDTVTLNGQLRKVQYISSNSLGYSFWGLNIEGIGNSVFMFPQGDMYMNGPMRCYEDSTGLIEFMTLPCDSIIFTSINKNETAENFKFYPSPASSKLFIEFTNFKGVEYSAYIYSSAGQIQISLTGIKNNITVDIDKLFPGLYFVRLIDSHGQGTTKKFIKD